MNPAYILPRLIRHFLPDGLVRFFLRRSLIIKPGLETRSPYEAAERYSAALKAEGLSIKGKNVLVFGYGGSYAVACALLQKGADHITLSEKEAPPDDRRNHALLAEFSKYLLETNDFIVPNPEFISLAQGDIRKILKDNLFDVIVSTSVFEHLDDVEGITQALALLTAPQGVNLHYVDLRDHFFKYPFEMLCYSREIWYGWLNPTSHHNRWRLPKYQVLFDGLFQKVNIEVLERDQEAFEKARSRIRSEFLSGDTDVDAVTLIKILAKNPTSHSGHT
ncbi:MAG: methyltransferase domain-containing protein [Anaerolineaceae bacterium]